MTDIWEVATNGLWVLGLAMLLSTLSWAHWAASEEDERLRIVLSRSGTQHGLDWALFLFCTGLAATSRRWWEQILWGLLALAWVVQALRVKQTVNQRESKDDVP
jgi:hypothetical protein